MEHQNWELAGIYLDEGTRSTFRPGLDRLIQACECGQIDVILTKNLSRISKNFADSIQLVKKLANLPQPVGVYLEAEKILSLSTSIDTLMSDGIEGNL